MFRDRSKMTLLAVLPLVAAQISFFASSAPVALRRCIETRAEQHARSAQHHHRWQARVHPRCRPRNDGHAAGHEIDNRRHDVDGGAGRAVPARLGTLGDQNVGTGIQPPAAPYLRFAPGKSATRPRLDAAAQMDWDRQTRA